MRVSLTLALTFIACVPNGVYATELFIAPSQSPPPINSPAFAVRAPLPGRAGYLTTIKFIDDGVLYIDPLSHFYISAAGEMCFHTRPSYPTVYTDAYYKDWCIHPHAIDRVSVIENFASSHGVEMWCMRAYPGCAHCLQSGEIANRVFAITIDHQQERQALQQLDIYDGRQRPVFRRRLSS
jgi:hypothetical protein